MDRTLQLVSQGTYGGRMGEYVSEKSFLVERDNVVDETANGFVVQRVQKECRAITYDGRIMDTSESFLAFTDGLVDYMCDCYIELFPIVRGESEDFDAFASGCIAKVENGESIVVVPPVTEEDYPFLTTGTILHTGTCLLFLDEKKIQTLQSFPWGYLPVANGLYTLPVEYWDRIVQIGSDVNHIPVHTVSASWRLVDNRTEVHSDFTNQ